jgi:hypothetical protein
MKPFGGLERLIPWRQDNSKPLLKSFQFGSGTAAKQYGSGAPFL